VRRRTRLIFSFSNNANCDRIVFGGDRLDILALYATPGTLRRGQSAQLCYGVSNAKSVRLDPPVAPMWPSLSRCISITPDRTTAYTLTAEDAAGHTKSSSFRLEVR
jgi:hypothetical protein